MNDLHMCWFVDAWRDTRNRYLQAWSEAGWHVVLWHAGQLTAAPENVEMVDVRELLHDAPHFDYELAHASHAACADLFRFEVLRRLGGGYSDLDVLPNEARAESEARFGAPQCNPAALEIRFLTASSDDPLISAVIEAQHAREEHFLAGGGYGPHYPFARRNDRSSRVKDRIPQRTGPALVKKVVQAYADAQHTPFAHYLIPNATIDSTTENHEEHFSASFPKIRRAVAAKYRSYL